MNAVQYQSAVRCYPEPPPQFLLFHDTESAPLRVAVFGSFQGGLCVLRELLEGPLSARIEVVGVSTDDPTQVFTHANVRLWKYPHSLDDELLVRRFVRGRELPVWTGRVKSNEFLEMFTQRWAPDLAFMATFGQKIPREIISVPRLGFYNFHHSDVTWPSYPGPDPIAAMLKDGKTEVVLNMHEVTEVIDGGRFVARSRKFPLPPGINAIELHRLTWPQMGPFVGAQVERFLELREQLDCAA